MDSSTDDRYERDSDSAASDRTLDSPYISAASLRNYGTGGGIDVDDRTLVLDGKDEVLLDGPKLWPLLLIPCGFGAFNCIQEYPSGGVIGVLGVVWWHVAFWMASVISTSKPRIATLLVVSAAIAPLFIETNVIVRQIHALAFITHALRFSTMLNESAHFSKRSWQFKISFVHYYHCLKGLRWSRDVTAESQVIVPRLLMSSLVAGVSMRVIHDYLGPPASNETVAVLEMNHEVIYFTRYGMCFCAFFFGISAIDDLYRMPVLVYFGLDMPSTFRDPLSSKTIAEFWSMRWNLVVQTLLKDGIFKPAMKLGVPAFVARVATFVGSAALHIVPLAVSDRFTISLAIWMMAFFVLQIVFIEVERMMGLKGLLWVTAAWCVSAPLFFEPLLEVYGM